VRNAQRAVRRVPPTPRSASPRAPDSGDGRQHGVSGGYAARELEQGHWPRTDQIARIPRRRGEAPRAFPGERPLGAPTGRRRASARRLTEMADLDNYALPLATRLRNRDLVSVWCAKRHAETSIVMVARAQPAARPSPRWRSPADPSPGPWPSMARSRVATEATDDQGATGAGSRPVGRGRLPRDLAW
jgi:hypothetical protein